MTKVKSYGKDMFPCIQDAIYEIMDKHLLVAADNSIYRAEALNEICFFLAANNIQHEYTILPAPVGAECDQVISLVWMEPGKVGNEIWYSRGRVERNLYRVCLTMRAEDETEIEAWISNIDEMKILEWSVEEV